MPYSCNRKIIVLATVLGLIPGGIQAAPSASSALQSDGVITSQRFHGTTGLGDIRIFPWKAVILRSQQQDSVVYPLTLTIERKQTAKGVSVTGQFYYEIYNQTESCDGCNGGGDFDFEFIGKDGTSLVGRVLSSRFDRKHCTYGGVPTKISGPVTNLDPKVFEDTVNVRLNYKSSSNARPC